MPARRLPQASTSEVERARVSFTFDGRRFEGLDGEPLAASLLAAGRSTLSRSFRFHRPRGLMCSTGQCGWCECEVDGRPSVRTCQVPVRDGMVVRGEHAWPSVEHDLLRVLDLGSRFVPPTFYHHRFLRPRRLRKWYLDVIRWFGGRGRLGSGAAVERLGRQVRTDAPDVLVVGAGRGGLLAAIAAAEAGARVVVVEAGAAAESELADGVPGEEDLLATARALGVGVRTATVASGWYAGTLTAIDDGSMWELRPRALVAATGTYELVPAIDGSDRPGVMSARLAARLVERYGVLPGERAVLVGAGEELESTGSVLRGVGATVSGPIATGSLRAIGGRGPVAWVRFSDGAGAGAPRRESVDLVVFGDRTPNLDLVLAAGARVEWRDGRLAPRLDADGQTTVAGLFAAGGAASASARTGAGTDQARRVGRAAAAFASTGRRLGASAEGTTRAGDPPRSASDGHRPAPGSADAVLCFCEDIRGREVHAEQEAGYADPELIKRRTGALTGPCQGKYCLSAVSCAMNGAAGATPTSGDPDPAAARIVLPTARPPIRPIRLGDLVAGEAHAREPDAIARDHAASEHR